MKIEFNTEIAYVVVTNINNTDQLFLYSSGTIGTADIDEGSYKYVDGESLLRESKSILPYPKDETNLISLVKEELHQTVECPIHFILYVDSDNLLGDDNLGREWINRKFKKIEKIIRAQDHLDLVYASSNHLLPLNNPNSVPPTYIERTNSSMTPEQKQTEIFRHIQNLDQDPKISEEQKKNFADFLREEQKYEESLKKKRFDNRTSTIEFGMTSPASKPQEPKLNQLIDPYSSQNKFKEKDIESDKIVINHSEKTSTTTDFVHQKSIDSDDVSLQYPNSKPTSGTQLLPQSEQDKQNPNSSEIQKKNDASPEVSSSLLLAILCNKKFQMACLAVAIIAGIGLLTTGILGLAGAVALSATVSILLTPTGGTLLGAGILGGALSFFGGKKGDAVISNGSTQTPVTTV